MYNNESQYREIFEHLSRLGLAFKDASMANYTTFACGGKADILLIPQNKNESLSAILQYLAGKDVPVCVIGGGSNLLVGDKGIRGVVIAIRATHGLEGRVSLEDDSTVYADAIVKKSYFIEACTSFSLGGVEFMAGIPGCIGGGIAMNAGTDTGVFSNILKSIVYCKRDGELCNTEDIKTEYRNLFIDEGAVICGAYFKLPADDSAKTKKNIDDILKARASKHPLEYPSAGSVFKNPEGEAAWKLINDAGLRGKRVGGAMVSEKHTNFIVNCDEAKAADVKELIELIQATIMEKFSIKMETEIKLIGEF